MADDYSPLYAGDTLAPLSVQFQHADGSAINLSGATLSLILAAETGSRLVGAGTWTIDNAAAGQAHYAWAGADVATPGTYQLQVELTVNGASLHTDPKVLIIQPTL